MQRVVPKVDVIVLNILHTDKEYQAYTRLTAEEKIDKISKAIINTINELKLKNCETNSLKIFVWREYGISNKDSRFCDINVSNQLKNKMLEITTENKDVCIIAGTIATKKHFDNFTIIDKEKVKDAYKHPFLQRIVKLEKKINYQTNTNNSTISEHEKNANDLDLTKGVTIVKNTCNVIYQDKTYKHGKLFPYFETKDEHEVNPPENIAFRPSKGNTVNPFFKITHPETGDEITFVVEICAEHPLGYTKELIKRNIIERPHIHFVASASSPTFPKNVSADYYIQADIHYQTPLLTNGNDTDIDLTLYKVNILNPEFSLESKPSNERIYKLEAMEYIDSIMYAYHGKKDLFSIAMYQRFFNLKSELIEIAIIGKGQEHYIKALQKVLGELNDHFDEEIKYLNLLEEQTSNQFFNNADAEKKSSLNHSKKLLSAIKKLTGFIECSKQDNSNSVKRNPTIS